MILDEKENFYTEAQIFLESAIEQVLLRIELQRKIFINANGRDCIDHCKSRVKSFDSLVNKLKKNDLDITLNNTIYKIRDAAGIRIVCPFIDDVYTVAKSFKEYSDIEIVKEKDYIANPKPNGYRSYHIILKLPSYLFLQYHDIYVEIQIRTIAMDFWASLEHQLKYKKEIENQEFLISQLKRCSDEITSTDLTLQSIRDIIENLENK